MKLHSIPMLHFPLRHVGRGQSAGASFAGSPRTGMALASTRTLYLPSAVLYACDALSAHSTSANGAVEYADSTEHAS